MTKYQMILQTAAKYPSDSHYRIAKRVGCSSAYVSQVLKAAGGRDHAEDLWVGVYGAKAKAKTETEVKTETKVETQPEAPKLTGGYSDYYKVVVAYPTSGADAYTAECNDIIEALDMTFAEGNIMKALWRRAAERSGNGKPGTTSLYDAEKIVFFAQRLLAQSK